LLNNLANKFKLDKKSTKASKSNSDYFLERKVRRPKSLVQVSEG
jgi:hypothetical protein